MDRKFLKAAPSAARVVGSRNGFAFEGASLCVSFGQFKSGRAIKLQASPRTEKKHNYFTILISHPIINKLCKHSIAILFTTAE
jgi:hypothetical protein